MASLTRRELVLQLLRSHKNEWVDGTAIASAEVGGSEGLKRLRELRQAGYDIRMRKHPDPRRDIFQYRLTETDHTSFGRSRTYHVDPFVGTTITEHPASPGMLGREFPLKKNEDGSIEIVWEICVECGGRYAVQSDHLAGEEHQRWLALSVTIEGQTSIPEAAQPPIYAYTEKPVGLSFGEAAVCPRCRGVRRKAKGSRPADELCMDPKDHTIYCRRCNGWGVVPNIGPVTMAAPPSPASTETQDPPTSEAFPDE